MPKTSKGSSDEIAFDISGSDPEKATAGMAASPKPGMYVAVIDEVNKGFSRDEDSGKPDKAKPRLEVIYKMVKADKSRNKRYVGGRAWDYYVLPGHESYEGFSVQKLDMFLQALGVVSGKKSRKVKGKFSAKKAKGTKVLVTILADTNLQGNYKGKVGQVLAYDLAKFKESMAASKEDSDEGRDDDDIEEADFDGPDFDALGEAADAGKKSAIKELTSLAEEAELDPDEYEAWADLAEALAEESGSEDEDGDSESEGDEDEDEDGDSEGDDDEEEEGPDFDTLGEEADGGKKAAIKELTGLAEEAELDPDDYETWAELAEALSEEGDEEGDEEEEEEEKPKSKSKSKAKSSKKGKGKKGKKGEGFPF